MSNNKEGQGFDDWFAANFADGPPKPASGTPPTPTSPEAPPTPPTEHWASTPPTQGAPTPPPLPPLVLPQQPAQSAPFSQFPTQQQPLQPPAEHWQQQPTVGPPSTMPPSAVPPTFTEPQPPAQPSFDPSLAGHDAAPTEFLPSATQAAAGGLGDPNALDALFGDDKFRDYEHGPPTVAAPGGSPGDDGSEPPKGISRTHITLMWVAGSAVALLALFAFFLVGTRLPILTGSGASPTETPAPVETERPEGPVEPGTYNWNELLGGECLENFNGAWENQYTVVDCAEPHAAQLVVRAAVPVAPGTGGIYPGVFDLQSRMNLLCTDAAVIDYHAANVYDDVQFEASFPPSAEEWDSGRRDYFCFVSRASGEPLEGSLAAPPALDEPADEEEGATDEGTGGD